MTDPPPVRDSTRGREARYRAVCICSAVELYSYPEGAMAPTNACWSCGARGHGIRTVHQILPLALPRHLQRPQ